MKHSGSIVLFNVRRVGLGSVDNGSDYLGLFYLAAVLEEKGYDPWVFHGAAHEVPDILEREAARQKIAAVGFACDFENRTGVEELSLFVKERHRCPVIVGGPQALALHEDFLSASRCDFVLRGEAEESLPQLLDCVLEGEGKLEDILGLAWIDAEGRMHSTPDRAPVSDLDSLPLPAYDRSLHKGRTYGRNVFTGRGCPFSCAFCYQSSHGKRVRTRDMGRVLEEIRRNLEAYPKLNYITLLDDTFTLSPKRVEAFCKGMDELRSGRDLVWYCESHVHLLARWPEMISMMVQSGLVRLQIGVESGNDEILKVYGKQATLDEIETVVREAVRAGVPQLATNLIIGGPLESEQTVEASAEFAERLLGLAPGVIDITTGFLRPYPCTAVTESPGAFGLAILDRQAIRSFDDYPVVVSSGSVPEDILHYRRDISARISNVMHQLMREGQVPRPAILSQYRNALRYDIKSLWYNAVFKQDPFLEEYFRLLVKGAARSMQDVPPAELMRWRPQRTVEMRKALNFEAGYPRIGGYVLSPLELELLLHCSGKLLFEEVIESLYEGFGKEFDDRQDFLSRIHGMMQAFDKKFWVVFCRV